MAEAIGDKLSLLSCLDAFSLPGAGADVTSTPLPDSTGQGTGKRRKSRCSVESAPQAQGQEASAASKRARKGKKQAESAAPAEELAPAVATTPKAASPKDVENQKSTKKYRQAKETDDAVLEVLCFTCRRSKDTVVQKSMMSFFKKKSPVTTEEHTATTADAVVLDAPEQQSQPLAIDTTVCAKCRRPMQQKGGLVKKSSDFMEGNGQLPQHQRWKAYRRTAERQGIPFTISEKAASAMMRQSCVACGEPAPMRGHGLTRLRKWPQGLEKPERGGFMGPYAEGNLAPACTMCNMLKGYRTVRGLVECCRHIATQHTPGEDFGVYHHRFRDNVSRRSRSCYITNSSTHTKTHAITNEDFNNIVAQKCYYCHKEPRKPKTLGPDDRGHFNGLDRLDSSNRVYTIQSTVACCGDCNIMKYKWELKDFLEQCRKVARFNVGTEFSDEAGSAGEEAEPEEGEAVVEEEEDEEEEEEEEQEEQPDGSEGA